MKTIMKISAVALVILLSGSYASAQRGTGRMMPDSVRYNNMMMHRDSLMMHGRKGMGPRGMSHNFRYGCPCCEMNMHGMHGMRPGMGMWGGRGFGMGPQAGADQFRQRHNLGSIPNLTDTQKKQIADLRQQQMDEMKKFREETLSKMKQMREDHKKKILNLLTDEQKKYLEGNQEQGTSPQGK